MGTIPLSIYDIDCIIYHPNDDEPGILFWLSDNTTFLNVFHDNQECDEQWGAIEHGLDNEDFIRFHDIRFRAERLKHLEKGHHAEIGYFLQFIFHSTRVFTQPYVDEQSMNEDLDRITNILGTLQEIRASRRFSQTKQ